MRYWSTVLLSLMLAAPAFANDSAVVGVGGSWKPMSGKHPAVRMVRERVEIDVHPSYEVTRATFVFENEGPAMEVRMGFPEAGWGDIAPSAYMKRSGFQSFVTSVDGKPVKAVRYGGQPTEEDYRAVWVKRVPFRAKQQRTVQASYRSQLGEIASSEAPHFVAYQFSGGNWKGDVAESVMVVRFHPRLPDRINATLDGTKPHGVARGNTITYRWTHWQAQGEFNLRFGSGRVLPER